MDNFRAGKAYNITSLASPTSTQGSAVSAGVTMLRVVASAAVQVRVGANPTAVTTDTLIPPNFPVFINVTPGEKLASVGAATVSVTECA